MKHHQILTRIALGFAVAFSAGCASLSNQTESADAIYFDGDIVTVNDANPSVEAVAVRQGKIIAVGQKADVLASQGAATQLVDLKGKTLVPGFIDAHSHFYSFGSQAIGANLLAAPDGTVTNIDDLVAQLQIFAKGPDVARTGWIFGLGYDDATLAEGRHPTAAELDRVSKDIPVMAIHISGHFITVNSAGLKKLGITAASKDPKGGVIRRKAGSQEPNGVLEELAAIPAMLGTLTPNSDENQAYFLKRGLELAKSFGYTTAQEGRAFKPNHDGMVKFAEQGGFDIDVVSYIDYVNRDLIESKWHKKDYTNHYRIGGLKITLDGSPQGRTAWRTKPYTLPPEGQKADYKGYPAFADDKDLIALYDLAFQKDWQVLTHANGDAAIDQMIRTITPAFNKYPVKDRRNTLIHGQFVRQDQFDSLKKLDMVASLFPMHTFYWGDWYDKIVGKEQAQQISPMRSALNRGLMVTSHTDAPVALPNLMQIMSATVNRTSRTGQVMGPDERLTPIEALKTITLWGAYQHFEDKTKGSIEVGKLADLVILSDNPLTIDSKNLGKIKVLETIKEGKSVYQAK